MTTTKLFQIEVRTINDKQRNTCSIKTKQVIAESGNTAISPINARYLMCLESMLWGDELFSLKAWC